MMLRKKGILGNSIMKKVSLTFILARNDFQKRFRGSYFGLFWIIAQPLVSITIYYCVFQLGFKSNPVEEVPYVIWLLPGIVPWYFLNDALQNGVQSFVSYRNIVKKLVFDIKLLPYVRVLSALFVHLIFILVMLVVFLLWGQRPTFWWLQIIYYIFCNIFLCTGLVFFTATLHVFMKDMGQLVSILLQFSFWLAPIMYNQEIMPTGFQHFIRWNPFCYIVEGFRGSLLFQQPFWMNPYGTVYFWVCSGTCFALGRFLLHRLGVHFSDLL